MKPWLSRLVLCALASLAATAWAQDQFPARAVRIVVPYPPGAITDVIPRLVAEKLREAWGQPVIIDNRPGANGLIAAEYVAKAPPDGYTLLVALPDHLAIAPSLYRKFPIDPLRDYVPITIMVRQAFVLVVRNDLPAARLVDLIKMAKGNPGKLRMSSWGEGSTGHLALELLKSMSGADIQHVPYKGAQAAMTDVVGGHVDMMITGYSTAGPHIKSGRVRVLGRTSAERSRLTPDIPTIAESGYPGYEVQSWYGLVAPGGTPRAVVDTIYQGVGRAMQSSNIRERIDGFYAEPVAITPDAFARLIRDEQLKWSAVIRAAKVQLD
ncbi:MAG: hypothetical protein A3G81_34105 [Betaproteobacteria bacterium RIFCSPLOWO2_12_FULL_65_14]|nr:MAG: hypothetical protein A3G81_34105 [Betaproteobacteria bacterium RIFCSPLOWO2_12_FULL_65_14]